MIKRSLDKDILLSLDQFPAVGIIGSRQVGKTTLALMVAESRQDKAVYLDLERPSDLAKLGDAELYLRSVADSLVIIDEIQRRPDLFPVMRSLVDEQRRPGRFLILGSASPALLRQSSESSVGRIVYHEFRSFNLQEVGAAPEDINRLWNRGGYPESFLAESDAASLKWREAFRSSTRRPGIGSSRSSCDIRDSTGLGRISRVHWRLCHTNLWGVFPKLPCSSALPITA